jgi:flagellar hook-associated protein 3 FlgL
MLTGVEDVYDATTDTYSDGTSYFYIKGRKPSGETFTTKFSLSNSQSVNDLLEKIGEAYGNTATTKVVDVSLNDMGQIQIKDINTGKMDTEFYMVASDKDEASFEDLVKNGDYIVEFQKSDFNTIRDENKIKANNGYFDNRIFQFASDFKLVDGSRNALPNDDISDVLGSEGIIAGSDTQLGSVDFIRLSGTDTNGNTVDKTYKIGTDVKTMDDLLKKIESDFGDVTARLENGKIIVTDNSLEDKNDTSKMSLVMQTYNDTDGDGVFEAADDKLVNALRRSDFANEDKAFFKSDGKMQISNVSQVTRDGYRTVNIVDDNGNIVDKKEEVIENPQSYATKDTRLADVAGYNKPEDLDGKEFVINFVDKDGNEKRAILTLRDTPYTDANGNKHYSTFWVDENNDGVQQDSEVYDIFGNSADALTPANDQLKITNELDPSTCEVCQKETLNKGMTYEQLNNVVSLLVSGEYKNIDNSDNETEFQTQQEAIKKAQSEINVRLDDKGRMVVEDNTNSVSNVRVAIFDKDTDNVSGNSPMLTFQSNNAVTIDEPQVDFFDTLQKAIDAVKQGNNYLDSNGDDPRNFGIQGAIEAIDHVTDHVRRNHAKIGAVSNEFQLTIERTDMLTLNVQQLQSENIDTDLGEATMRLNSLQTSYQALLASIAKVNNLTLLNYL